MWKKFEGRWCGSVIRCGCAGCAKGGHGVDAVCEWFSTRWRGERDRWKLGGREDSMRKSWRRYKSGVERGRAKGCGGGSAFWWRRGMAEGAEPG